MGGYANGRFPLEIMEHLGGDHYLPPGTAARWRWLVEQAWLKYGVLLRITWGWNGYRPYAIQVEYRNELGEWAAVPGYSSHGIVYSGQQVAAIDVDNWAVLGWGRFSALCRLAGFRVDFVSPQELWHIGDFNDIWNVPDWLSDQMPAWKPAPPLPYYARVYARRKKNRTMIAMRIVDGRGHFGPAGKEHYYLIGGGIFVETTEHATANDVSAIVQGYDSTGKLMGTPNLTYRELYDYARGCNALTEAELQKYKDAAGVV